VIDTMELIEKESERLTNLLKTYQRKTK
jgi:hypothetical protein